MVVNKKELTDANAALRVAYERLGEKPKEKYQVLRETLAFKLPATGKASEDVPETVDGVAVHKSKLPKPASKRELNTAWRPNNEDITPLSKWETLPSSSVWCEGTKRQDRYFISPTHN